MADTLKGMCVVCGGQYALAKDGTPYKHASTEGDPCPGSSVEGVEPQDILYRLYGKEVDGNFPIAVTGPINAPETHPFGDEELPIMAEFDHNPRLDEINALLPEQHRLPAPQPGDAPLIEAPADSE